MCTPIHAPRVDLSVVSPVYNEDGNVEELVRALLAALSKMSIEFEIILVDDGSQDQTWSAISAASEKHPEVKGVSLSRNFGHQNAVFAGLHYATGRAVITMDGDLQHPPETIPALYEAWGDGSQVVETRRIDSEDTPFLKALTSKVFYWFFSFLSGIPMSPGTSDFRLMDKKVVDSVLKMNDSNLFLRGIAHWVGYKKTTIPYTAQNRFSGSTKYDLSRMIAFASSSLISFSIIPLKLGIWLGLFTSGISFIELIYIFFRFFRGNVVPGWASTLAVLSLMFGILFILLGIIGIYLGSLFETVKNRPRFLT